MTLGQTPKGMRRYSLYEIDSMRRSLYAIESANERFPLEGSWIMGGSWQEIEKQRATRVEDQLRTYMLGGVGPDEVAAKADKAKEEQKKWYEDERKKIADRQLQAEYGPRL